MATDFENWASNEIVRRPILIRETVNTSPVHSHPNRSTVAKINTAPKGSVYVDYFGNLLVKLGSGATTWERFSGSRDTLIGAHGETASIKQYISLVNYSGTSYSIAQSVSGLTGINKALVSVTGYVTVKGAGASSVWWLCNSTIPLHDSIISRSVGTVFFITAGLYTVSGKAFTVAYSDAVTDLRGPLTLNIRNLVGGQTPTAMDGTIFMIFNVQENTVPTSVVP